MMDGESRMRVSIGVVIWIAVVVALTVVPGHTAHATTPRNVQVRLLKSPFADYLVYLLYRGTGRGQFKAVEQAVPLGDIPTLSELISLPGVAASARIRTYSQLHTLLEPYRRASNRIVEVKDRGIIRFSILGYSAALPSFDDLSRIVALGEASYPKFARFWDQTIAPAEDKKIAEWREQLVSTKPFDKLQRLARLRFPADSIDIVAIALHGAGSANSHPAAIYTGISVRNVAWAIGHEGTHLLVDKYAGQDWTARARSAEAIRSVEARGGNDYDIEEALCLLMQAKLSQAAGLTPSDFRVSTNFTEVSAKRDILVALEDGWQEYQQSAAGDLIDFLLTQTIQAMRRR